MSVAGRRLSAGLAQGWLNVLAVLAPSSFVIMVCLSAGLDGFMA
jgi:hypothetical protein